MTTARLRELMDERVADVEGRDLAALAWARADGVRRRRRYAVMGTAAAAVLVVAGGVAVLDDRTGTENPPSTRPTSTPSDSPSPTLDDRAPQAVLSGRFRGAPFWWAPPATQDAELPVLQVPELPETLSMADEEPVATPPDHVDAAFGTAKQQYRLLTDGHLVSVDLSDRLGPVGDESGNMFNPLGPRSVSPDGTRVAFRQPGRVEVWDLPSNTWTTIPTPDYESAEWFLYGDLWVGDGPPPRRPDPWTGPDVQYSQIVVGPTGEAELDWTVDRQVPGADEPGHYANPEILAARQDGMKSVLALGIDGRSKICCSPVGWFSHDFVLFEASSVDRGRVLAWRVGTPDLYRVSEFADLPRQGASSSWAENAFTGYGS